MKKIAYWIAAGILCGCMSSRETARDEIFSSGRVRVVSIETEVPGWNAGPSRYRTLHFLKTFGEVTDQEISQRMYPTGHPCASPYYTFHDVRRFNDGDFLVGMGMTNPVCSQLHLARVRFSSSGKLESVSTIDVPESLRKGFGEYDKTHAIGFAEKVFSYIDSETGNVVHWYSSPGRNIDRVQVQRENKQWLVFSSNEGNRNDAGSLTFVVNPEAGELISFGKATLQRMVGKVFLLREGGRAEGYIRYWTQDLQQRVIDEKRVDFKTLKLDAKGLEKAASYYRLLREDDRREASRGAPPPAITVRQKDGQGRDFALAPPPINVEKVDIDFNRRDLSGNALKARNTVIHDLLREMTIPVDARGKVGEIRLPENLVAPG